MLARVSTGGISQARTLSAPGAGKKLLQSAGSKVISGNRVAAALSALVPEAPAGAHRARVSSPGTEPSKAVAILPNYDASVFDPRMI